MGIGWGKSRKENAIKKTLGGGYCRKP